MTGWWTHTLHDHIYSKVSTDETEILKGKSEKINISRSKYLEVLHIFWHKIVQIKYTKECLCLCRTNSQVVPSVLCVFWQMFKCFLLKPLKASPFLLESLRNHCSCQDRSNPVRIIGDSLIFAQIDSYIQSCDYWTVVEVNMLVYVYVCVSAVID